MKPAPAGNQNPFAVGGISHDDVIVWLAWREAKAALAEPVRLTQLDAQFKEAFERDVTKGPRTIDLDLLLYGDESCNTPLLTVPHPRLQARRFVLAPLAEIAPEFVHPILDKTIRSLLAHLADDSEVQLWRPWRQL